MATVAFGMGVDAQGVRGVVHMTLPRSLEEYVQQVRHAFSYSALSFGEMGVSFQA